MAKVTALIPAAGQGKRMQAEINKQYLMLADRPILARTLEVFQAHPEIEGIIVIVALAEVDWCQREIIQTGGFTKVKAVVSGGAERQDSVYRGLQALDADCQWVVVHDGARPLLESQILSKTLEAARECQAAIAAVPVKDTIKVSKSEEFVEKTLERQYLWSIQTPQVFQRSLLQTAYIQGLAAGYQGTDDASFVERCGAPVKLVLGSYENIKITTPEDLDYAQAILARRRQRNPEYA